MPDTVQFLTTDQLQPNPFQPRSKIDPDELAELIQSVKTYGILEPLVIAQTPAGFQIIAGERRWRAAQAAGLETVPALVKKTTPKGMLEMALVENVQRSDLSAIDRAQAFQQLLREFKMSTAQVAEKIGKSSAYISNSLKLLTLPDAIKDGLLGSMITEGHARALSGITREKSMVECYKIILKENASVRRAEELSRRFKERDEQNLQQLTGGKIPTASQIKEELVKEWQQKFQTHFHAKTHLKVTRSTRHTRVVLTFQGPPEKTQADLEKFIEYSEVS